MLKICAAIYDHDHNMNTRLICAFIARTCYMK
jgi:hypothetical protein